MLRILPLSRSSSGLVKAGTAVHKAPAPTQFEVLQDAGFHIDIYIVGLEPAKRDPVKTQDPTMQVPVNPEPGLCKHFILEVISRIEG